MLVRCQRFGDWFLFGLVQQYSSIQKNIIKVGAKSWMLTCSYHITLSLPFYTDPDTKRELNFCNGYLSLLYFWVLTLIIVLSIIHNIIKYIISPTGENVVLRAKYQQSFKNTEKFTSLLPFFGYQCSLKAKKFYY